jgi:hypothetical protein
MLASLNHFNTNKLGFCFCLLAVFDLIDMLCDMTDLMVSVGRVKLAKYKITRYTAYKVEDMKKSEDITDLMVSVGRVKLANTKSAGTLHTRWRT